MAAPSRPPRPAAPAATHLPQQGLGRIVVDAARGHVFLSGAILTDSNVVVVDEDGKIVKRRNGRWRTVSRANAMLDAEGRADAVCRYRGRGLIGRPMRIRASYDGSVDVVRTTTPWSPLVLSR